MSDPSATFPLVELRERENWRADAACVGYSTDMFFTFDGEASATWTMRKKEAQAICAECPVKVDCLTAELRVAMNAATGSAHGIFGGLDAEERNALARRLVGGPIKKKENNRVR